MNPSDRPIDDALDRATAHRLSRLRAMPVDTSRIDRVLRARIPEIPHTPWFSWKLPAIGPVRAAAAILIVIGLTVAAFIASSSGPATASTVDLAAIHRQVSMGHSGTVAVDSIEEANQALMIQWSASPELPDVPGSEVMACCIQSMGRKRLAVVSLLLDGKPVTLAVANASDMHAPKSTTIVRGSSTYHAQSSGGVNMVMLRRGERWICLMSEAPTEQLIHLAEQVK